MTREIKFRGKRTDNGRWWYGSLVIGFAGRASIVGEKHGVCEVDPSTVGQYTGLKDKNGNEIWEGDLVKANDWFLVAVEYGIQEVDAFEGIGFNLWDFYGNHDDIGKAIRLQQSIEVVGNIHDNPDLIKSKEND